MNSWIHKEFVLLSVKFQDPAMFRILEKYYYFTRFQCDQISETGDFTKLILCTVKDPKECITTTFRTVSTAIKRCKKFKTEAVDRRYYSTFLPTQRKVFERILDIQTGFIKKSNMDYSHTNHCNRCCIFKDNHEAVLFKKYYYCGL